MSSWILNTTLLLTGSLCSVLAFMPASAQDVSEWHQQPSNPIPGVRYTTGSVTTSGWEKNLTDGDPNLKNWHWSAVTSYTQNSYNRVPAGAFLKKDKPGPQQALRPPGSIYIKPIQISPETYAKKRIEPGVINVGDMRTHSSLSGRVRLPHPQQPQVALSAPPRAKSYNVNYGVGGTVHVPHDAESVASRQVYGHLMKTQ